MEVNNCAVLVTGAAGFIGSNLAQYFNGEDTSDLVLVDDFTSKSKERNYRNLKFLTLVDRDAFAGWLENNHNEVSFIIHLGARTNTVEFDRNIFEKLNFGYSRQVFSLCSQYEISLIYASSAATYGDGELGYIDDHKIVDQLKPLNPYGESKNDFDKWVLTNPDKPPFWAGLKFFNVYGPGEYHKGRMASVVFHAFNQIRATGEMKLFRSHKRGIPDGGQKRDFIYVNDVLKVIFWLYKYKPQSGIYNLGTGKARTFLDLTNATFNAMGIVPSISFIDTPEDIREKYQYFTEARMEKLVRAGYTNEFYSLEQGVKEYVQDYLLDDQLT
jgi:ADP-L-glycero-D-manno-heptose 6-epimerase